MAPLGRALGLAGAIVCGCALLGSPGLASPGHRHHRRPHRSHLLRRPTWLSGVRITEYYPVPESWFVGRRVTAPGLPGTHRIDWLFSARGVSMEGDGIDLSGRQVHIESLGHGGWIDLAGHPTAPGRRGWSGGGPYWRAGGYWLSASRRPTFPLEAGGWSAGAGVKYVPLRGVTFAPGPSRSLSYYRSIAVDPTLIPMGSRIYIPAYHGVGGGSGWFVAADTGGAVRGRHVDVYRPPPASPADTGNSFDGQRIYVIPPHAPARPAPGTPPAAPPKSPAGGGAPGPDAAPGGASTPSGSAGPATTAGGATAG
jgi:3D (Asp-Asp-Asp) domain-containing protein